MIGRIEVLPEGRNVFLRIYSDIQESPMITTLGSCSDGRDSGCIVQGLISLLDEHDYAGVKSVGIKYCKVGNDSLWKLRNCALGVDVYSFGGRD